MASSLSKEQRNQLAKITSAARAYAESAAKAALENLAVHESKPRSHMKDDAKKLRNRLRARGRALGDVLESDKSQGIPRLIEMVAYENWHRLLFTRFLTENNLLITDKAHDSVPVTLADCEELAKDLGARDGQELACRFASALLPGVFRADDPALELRISIDDEVKLRNLLQDLTSDIFLASDSLGWTYQFWQADKKDKVNAGGNKIGADELPSVTQLFTEDYMVDFLLDNTLGAWWAGKVLDSKPTHATSAQSEEECRKLASLPGIPWKYLRFIKDINDQWKLAAGTFEGWPKTAKELKCLDPCMGSGHFVVAMFERLVALRMAEEKLDEAAAVAAVIQDNLFGLEIDPRCTQIAAFNLALAAWRRVGHCALPAMNLACSGLAPNAKLEDWLDIVTAASSISSEDQRLEASATSKKPNATDKDQRLEASATIKLSNGMTRLYELFKDAPVLGSLINPRLNSDNMYVADYHELQPLLEKALKIEEAGNLLKKGNQSLEGSATLHEMAVTASGLAKAAEILASQFTLVATNVPYLARSKQDEVLKNYCDNVHSAGKADIATCFVERSLGFSAAGGSIAIVTPQNWLFLGTYKMLRQRLLKETTWNCAARLGAHAFETIGGEIVNVVLVVNSIGLPDATNSFLAIEASELASPSEKAGALHSAEVALSSQAGQLKNPDSRIALKEQKQFPLLEVYADCFQGVSPADFPHYGRMFWEVRLNPEWRLWQSTVEATVNYGGRIRTLWWNKDLTAAVEAGSAYIRGEASWGKLGVAVSAMGDLPCTLYLGEASDTNAAIVVPKNQKHLAAIWCFCASTEYNESVREIDQGLKVTNATLVKIPFDLAHWQKIAAEKYPHGLPKPFSSDPTQWLFNGHPKDSDQPLQVAMARLLGYQWPRQTGSSFPDCPALKPDGLEEFADADGVVCLQPLRGEQPAAHRLREILNLSFSEKGKASFDEKKLIASSGLKGSKATNLEDWLRDEFFEQHCALFHHRPFIWHIWDGRKDGFHALLNYHKLDHETLKKLTFTHLGDWIRQQNDDAKADKPGAAERLGAAEALQKELEFILKGQPPYDIFVRWKSLQQQAKGWHPDLNDGVRMNIRPLMLAIDMGKKGAGILRAKPNIKWDKDRGKEPERDKKEFPWFWCNDEPEEDPKPSSVFAGNRFNNVHLSLEFKTKGKKSN